MRRLLAASLRCLFVYFVCVQCFGRIDCSSQHVPMLAASLRCLFVHSAVALCLQLAACPNGMLAASLRSLFDYGSVHRIAYSSPQVPSPVLPCWDVPYGTLLQGNAIDASLTDTACIYM